eukprot:NODE_18_length_40692_cov_0.469183.p24 type:complete len:103 gc:universal NODE_18_length_40692_cov_0.469183:29280-29588(+)
MPALPLSRRWGMFLLASMLFNRCTISSLPTTSDNDLGLYFSTRGNSALIPVVNKILISKLTISDTFKLSWLRLSVKVKIQLCSFCLKGYIGKVAISAKFQFQ